MEKNKTISNTWKLIICIAICQATGIISGLISSVQNNRWYDSIQRPSWNPPGYLFGPVWTILYVLMAISLYIVWKSSVTPDRKFFACWTFAVQLFLNFWWTILFFTLQSPLLAFVDIVLLILVIVSTIFQFSKISKTAAWLLVPYISWVCFAAILNYNLWILNK